MKFVNSACALAAAASCAHHVLAMDLVTSEKLQRDIVGPELMKNLNRLDRIARDNGGNRAFGFPGFTASVEYVSERARRFSRTIDTWVQDFPALFNHVESISFKVGDEDIYVYGLTYSPSTPPEGVTAPLVLAPEGAAGCSVEGYADLDVKDKIVLIQRYACPGGGTLAGRVRPAKLAGASNVIIYNNVPSLVTAGTLSAPDPEGYVSSGFINQVDGERLKARLLAGEQLTAYFQQTQVIQTRITQNVFAETKGGDPNNVIMVGAHLDSVQAGAGINDDGSGTSLILELLTGLKQYNVKNKVRFAWWGAEENGLLGSRYYTSHLNTTEVNNILCYLNFDMVSRGYFGVFDGDGSTHGLVGPAGSEVIEKFFNDYFAKVGITTTPAAFTGGSDYASFMDNLRKPVGGLHTGTGTEQDPCYHQKCDTYNNANATVLTANAKAAAHVLATLALHGHEIIPKNIMLKRQWEAFDGSIKWTEEEGGRHTGTCGHDV
ncbi:hypothetical protein BDZ91DRAFT_46971 [Kalaharituber pfeilii]|nr:hypothetical protein BDZ91DRAFT_46971 [Kalaharituber pfeilii]